MVKFYQTKTNGNTDGWLCIMQNEDGSFKQIYISQNDKLTRIYVSDNHDSPLSKFFGFNWEEESGVEFIEAYIRASTDFNRMASHMFVNLNSK